MAPSARSCFTSGNLIIVATICFLLQFIATFKPNILHLYTTTEENLELIKEILPQIISQNLTSKLTSKSNPFWTMGNYPKAIQNITKLSENRTKYDINNLSTSDKPCKLMYDMDTIDNLFINWRELFNEIILTQCYINLEYLISILIKTKQILSDILPSSLNQTFGIESNVTDIRYVDHDIIALRRYILIITYPFMNEAEIEINHTKILEIFIKFFENHLYHRRYSIDYRWFHFHISKSAGTTIKKAMYDLFNQGPNGQYVFNQHDLVCSKQYRVNKNRFYIEREQALFTWNDYYSKNKKHGHVNPYHGPSLCDKFMYIMPFREPLERICSQASQMNRHPIFNLQNIFIKYESYIKKHSDPNQMDVNDPKHRNVGLDRKDYFCYNQNVTINGVVYRAVLEGIDYQNFYVELLESELEPEYQKLKVPTTVDEVWDRIAKTSVNTENLTSFDAGNDSNCWNGPESDRRWTPLRFKGDVNRDINQSEFIFAIHKNAVDLAWHRCISASNPYTTWLGYNYSRDINEFSHHPSYVPRYLINKTHFINAINLMNKIDYVLPFESFSNNDDLKINDKHQIWKIMLNHLYDYFDHKNITKKVKNKEKKWNQANASKRRMDRVSSTDICKYLTSKDRQILDIYNQFDYKLYEIAKLIEIADVLFYNKFADSS